MLVVSGTSKAQNHNRLVEEFARPRIVTDLIIHGSRIEVLASSWHDYWSPAKAFLARDTRLVNRFNRLKSAWRRVLRAPRSMVAQERYCWRYFGLLHHALRVAQEEPKRGDPLPTLRCLIGFEAFSIRVAGLEGVAAGVVTHRNPVYLVGRLAPNSPAPTPRHVALVLPANMRNPTYHYRQMILRSTPQTSMLVAPSTELALRVASFRPIDRLARLLTDKSDPYWKPRAHLLVQRILRPLLNVWEAQPCARVGSQGLSILDLGAGTGHLVAKSWRYLCRDFSLSDAPAAAIHCVDSSGPCFGRSFGLARGNQNIRHVEWTTGDYRAVLDDDDWLRHNGPFDWVFACRLFDNASNFSIESLDSAEAVEPFWDRRCMPHWCLAPRRIAREGARLLVRTTRRPANDGDIMPQFSLAEYFGAMRVVCRNTWESLDRRSCYLPVRRFNPAALLTRSGRSVLIQLLRVAKAIVIEDMDLRREHLASHKQYFDLSGSAAVHCCEDGFATEARHYVITRPEYAASLRGVRLW
jgi:hypothetical protein